MQMLKKIEKQIADIKKQIFDLGDMHPGSLSKQFNICGCPTCKCKDPVEPKKHGPYYQLSFVHRGKSTSRFIKPQFVPEIKQQVANYKKFKELVEQWKALAADAAKIKIDAAKNAQQKNQKSAQSD